MKKTLILLCALGLNTASAAPFIFPNTWTVNQANTTNLGGILHETILLEPRTFNPYTETTIARVGNTYGVRGLFIIDPTNDDIVPYMAESYSISANKLVWTVNIRQGMKWSDGKPIIAADWVTTARIHTAPDTLTNQRSKFLIDGSLITVAQKDNYTLVYTFPKPVSNAVETLAVPPFPDHIFRPIYDTSGLAGIQAMWGLNENPNKIVTAGAFKLQAYQAGNRVIYEKNPFFGDWNVAQNGIKLPFLDGVQQLYYKDRNALITDFTKGQLELFFSDSPREISQVEQAKTQNNLPIVLKTNAISNGSSSWFTFNWNKKSDPFKQELFRNILFRQAISHMVNRKRIVAEVYNGLSKPEYSAITNAFGSWNSPDSPIFEYNLEAAKNLLTKIGFRNKNQEGYLVNRDGKTIEFELLAPTININNALTLGIIQEDGRRLGIKINLRYLPVNTIIGILTTPSKDRQFDAIYLSLALNTPGTYPLNGGHYSCTGRFHFYNNSGSDSCIDPLETQAMVLYERGRQTLDTTQRRALVHKVQAVSAQLQAMIHIATLTTSHAWQNSVRGELVDWHTGSTRWLETTWIQPQ